MSIGIFGFFILLITIPLIFMPVNNLLLAAVLFSPFYECAVISFNSFYLQPGHYFLFLYIFASVLSKKNGPLSKMKKPNTFLLMFVIVAFISILIALFFNINVSVFGIGNGLKLKSSIVSNQNFTQFVYLFLGFVMYWLFYNYCVKNERQWDMAVRVMTISGITIIAIGFYQLLADTYKLPFDIVFRSTHHKMWQSLSRVQSTMGEASYLGQYLTWFLTLLLTEYSFNNIIIKYLLMGCVVVLGVLTRSSTVLLGLISVFMLYGLLQKNNLKNVVKYVSATVILCMVFIYFYQNNNYLQILVVNTINKATLETTSGIQRNYIFKYMFDVGMRYPITGIGYGGGRSTDLYTNIFAMTGLLGVLSFFGFICSSMLKLITKKNRKGVLVCLLILGEILVTGVSVPEINYLVLWTLFGLIDARVHLSRLNNVARI